MGWAIWPTDPRRPIVLPWSKNRYGASLPLCSPTWQATRP